MSPTSGRNDSSDGFDPRLLIDAANEQAPECPWLPDALARCGAGEWESRAYVGYVERQNPDQPGSDWQFQNNIVLHHVKFGMVIIDILIGNHIGGIELVDRI